jgi:type 1 glutamine amidotransferase
LPTEAEWEYACRAGSNTRFSFGNFDTALSVYGWYSNNSANKAHPVGQKKPNAFGLYDMHGNVWEWCSDWYDENYYTSSPSADPTGPEIGGSRVLRGGSWVDFNPKSCRSAGRFYDQNWDSSFLKANNWGFRIVLEEEDWPRGNERKTLEQVTSTQAKLDSTKKSPHQKITPEARRHEYINWLSQAHDVKVSAAEIQKIDRAAPVKATVQPAKPRKLLVFNLCNGFWHSSIPYWDKALEIMGRKTGAYSVMISKDIAVFEPDNLNQFDAVCFNNTTKLKFNPEDTPELCKALMDFVKGGKGIVGIHAATDNFYDWPEAMEMMGSKFTGHPWTSGGTWAIKIDDPGHPLMRTFRGQGFKIQDEIYRTDPPLYSRSKQRVLMSLDMSDPTTRNVRGFKPTDTDTGISWIKAWDKGRVFYCGLGHNHHVVWIPIVLQHCLDGIQFAFGDLKADTK